MTQRVEDLQCLGHCQLLSGFCLSGGDFMSWKVEGLDVRSLELRPSDSFRQSFSEWNRIVNFWSLG